MTWERGNLSWVLVAVGALGLLTLILAFNAGGTRRDVERAAYRGMSTLGMGATVPAPTERWATDVVPSRTIPPYETPPESYAPALPPLPEANPVKREPPDWRPPFWERNRND